MKHEKIEMGRADGYGAARVRGLALPHNTDSFGPIKAAVRSRVAGPPEIRGSFMLSFFRLSLFVLFLLPVTFLGAAQNSRDSSVAVVDFVGDDAALTTWFHDLVFSEVENLKGFNPRPFALETFPESPAFKPDFPPDPAYLEGAPYVLTGEYYLDTETLQHFQLWLWNSDIGSLIYTDEMVFEEMAEAENYVPPMITWIFSHVPQVVIVEKTIDAVGNLSGFLAESANANGEQGEGRRSLFTGRLYLGLHGGVLFNTYRVQSSGNYEAGTSQGLGGEGAALVEFGIFPFLSLRAEAVFTYDTIGVINSTRSGQLIVRSTGSIRAMSLMLPLLLQLPLKFDFLTLTPFGGVYLPIPLGKMKSTVLAPVKTESSNPYTINPPIGFLFGLEIGISLGPGDLFVDLRFGKDFGMTIVEGGSGPNYFQDRIGLSLGYKILVLKL